MRGRWIERERERESESCRARESCAIKRRQINNVDSKRVASFVCAALARIVIVACGPFMVARFGFCYFASSACRLLIIISTCCEFESSFMLTMAQLEQQCEFIVCLVEFHLNQFLLFVIAACHNTHCSRVQ